MNTVDIINLIFYVILQNPESHKTGVCVCVCVCVCACLGEGKLWSKTGAHGAR